MAETALEHKLVRPDSYLSDVVESFWMIANRTEDEKDVIVLPDGRFDIFFSFSATEPYHVTFSGLTSEPSRTTVSPRLIIFAVSFKPLAIEYVLQTTASSLLNKVSRLPADFWGITMDDLTDFDRFCAIVSDKIAGLINGTVDERKRKLFDLIYASEGSLTVHQLSEAVDWSSRQINRYFKQWFGLSLKTYCTIIRYRASFNQIKEGKLFPEQNFVDQAHFIRDVKKYSGVTPKELARNPNDRFIQFSTLPET